MRKLLLLSLLALLTAGATGCMSNPCGGWHPGALLGRHPAECCCHESTMMSAPVYQQGCGCQ
jgi:hypothetical protein